MNKKIAIDIGTSSVLIYIKGKGMVLQEPTVIAVDTITNRVIKAGREAKEMTERTAENVVTVSPISAGVINRYTHTLVMLRKFLERSCGKFVVRPDITISVPCCISDVEEMAFRDIAIEAGAKNVYLVDAPFAAAIGAGIDVLAPVGNMIIDIGGGTTDVAVVSLGGIVESVSVKCGGNNFNEALIKHIKAKYGVSISDATAEEAKIKAGTVLKDQATDVIVKGKGERTPTPVSVTVTGTDILEAFEEPVTRIAEAVCSLLEKIPPELHGLEQGVDKLPLCPGLTDGHGGGGGGGHRRQGGKNDGKSQIQPQHEVQKNENQAGCQGGLQQGDDQHPSPVFP